MQSCVWSAKHVCPWEHNTKPYTLVAKHLFGLMSIDFV